MEDLPAPRLIALIACREFDLIPGQGYTITETLDGAFGGTLPAWVQFMVYFCCTALPPGESLVRLELRHRDTDILTGWIEVTKSPNLRRLVSDYGFLMRAWVLTGGIHEIRAIVNGVLIGVTPFEINDLSGTH